jgi:hypothetical protein
MKWWLLGGLLGLGITGWTGSTATEPAPQGRKEATWLTDYETARKVARASGKPIFVVFR